MSLDVIHSNMNDTTEFPEKLGEWQIVEDRDQSPPAKLFMFACPRAKDQLTCMVPIAPATTPAGAKWHWDGNTTEPTLTPSIHCTGGCGWHGFVRSGKMEEV